MLGLIMEIGAAVGIDPSNNQKTPGTAAGPSECPIGAEGLPPIDDEWPEMRVVRRRLTAVPDRIGEVADNLGWCRDVLGLTSAAACSYLAQQYRQNEQWDEALYVLWLRCFFEPLVWGNWIVLLRFLEVAGWPEDRLAMRRRADAVLGGSVDGHVQLGLIALSVNETERAQRHFQDAREIGGESAAVLGEIGQAYLQRGFVGHARRFFDEAARRGDDHGTRMLAETESVVALLGAVDDDRALLPERAIDGLLALAQGQPPMDAVARRVVVVVESLRSAGAERQVVNTVRGLATGAYDFESLTGLCGSLRASEKHDFYLPKLAGLDIELFEYGRRPDTPATLRDSPYETWTEVVGGMPTMLRSELAPLYQQFCLRRPEVVHIWQDWANIVAGLAAVMAGVPRVILSARNQPPYWTASRLPLGGRFYRDAYAALVAMPNVVFSHNSHAAAAEFATWLGRDLAEFVVVHNGTDFPDLDAASRAGAEFAPGHRVVGSIMRFEHDKRPDLWLRTAALVSAADPDVRFVLVGDGPLREAIVGLCDDLGLADRVEFVGRREDVKSWVERMDVLLLTSLLEGVPNVVVEAQGQGVAVVTSNVGGVAEVFDQGQSGWIVDRDTPEALAERVIWVLNNPEWQAAAKDIGVRTARARFAMQRMLDETVELYWPGDGGA